MLSMTQKVEFYKCKEVFSMEILNLILFGCVFYIALIGIPTLCEKK